MKREIQKTILIATLILCGWANVANAQSIAGGVQHSIFLCSDATVRTCGNNWGGQLGDGTNVEKNTPVQVSSLSGMIAIGGGAYYHSLAVKSDGSAWAWGYGYYGQLGNAANNDSNVPVLVS